MIRRIVVEIISFLFISLFAYASISKIIDHENFVIQLSQSPILTSAFQWVSWFVPLTEVLIALMLSARAFRLMGLYASFGLMVCFTGYIVVILSSGVHIPCSCGGVLEMLGWREHLLFNVFFILLGIAGILLHTPDRFDREGRGRGLKIFYRPVRSR